MKKQLSLLFVTTLLVGSLSFVSQAHAQTANSSNSGNFFEGLIAAIAQKFGLDQTQVKTAVTQYTSTHKHTRPTWAPNQQTMQQREDQRLSALVTSGKITADQKTAIEAELTSLYQKYNLSSTTLTMVQRRTAMQSMQSDLKAWATSQNINYAYVMPGFGGRGMHGMWKSKLTPTPSP